MARKRLGRRERAALKEIRRLALIRDAKAGISVAVGKRRTMWRNDGIPFVKPRVRPWEYNGYTARRINYAK